METTKLLWLIGVAILAALLFYVLLPKLNPSQKTGLIIRAVLFFSMICYLAYDFYTKGKYWYILVLVGGSIAFAMMLFNNKNKDEK
jgi:hypothetical protein